MCQRAFAYWSCTRSVRSSSKRGLLLCWTCVWCGKHALMLAWAVQRARKPVQQQQLMGQRGDNFVTFGEVLWGSRGAHLAGPRCKPQQGCHCLCMCTTFVCVCMPKSGHECLHAADPGAQLFLCMPKDFRPDPKEVFWPDQLLLPCPAQRHSPQTPRLHHICGCTPLGVIGVFWQACMQWPGSMIGWALVTKSTWPREGEFGTQSNGLPAS